MRGFLFLLAITAAAQDNSEPTFRTGTELVQVSVVAQDKNGKPVPSLRREDFHLFDNGMEQKIALFLEERPAPAPEIALPPGVFTNQIATDAHGGYSVLLFDKLNIDSGGASFGHISRVREKTLRVLKAMPPGEHLAVYALGCRFEVVREFSSDWDSLVQRVDRLAPAPARCLDPSSGGPEHNLTERVMGMASPSDLSPHAQEGAAGIAAGIEADLSDVQIKQLVEHLAGIPGRKNLIWLATSFRVKPANLQKILNANVAVYPVDLVGSTIGLEADKRMHEAPIRALAAMTGGKAYIDRDDLDVAIAEALNDGRFSYTLGFYRGDDSRKAAVHRIEVRISRADVTLRHRTSYSVEAPPPRSTNPVQPLIDALERPVNATAIGMAATPVRRGSKLDLALALDVAALDLQQKNGFWDGQAELVARFMRIDGKMAGSVVPLTVHFRLKPATYTAALQNGLRIRRQIDIPAKAVDLNLLVGNLASGKIGTLTVPLADVKDLAPAGKK